VILMGARKIRTGMQTVKARLVRFQMGMRTLENWTGGHSRYIVTKDLSTFCACPKIL
jgi:hypothetical protein